MTAVGEFIEYQSETGRYHLGRVTDVVSGDRVHMIAWSDGADWPDMGSGTTGWYYATLAFQNVDKGSSVGQWRYSADTEAAIEATDDDSGLCMVPAIGAGVTLAANTTRQPNTTRPVLLTVMVSWAWTLSATGSLTATLALQSDGTGTPSAVQKTASFARAVTVGLTVGDSGTMSCEMTYFVPIGHRYQLVPGGNSSAGLSWTIREQVL